MSIAMTVVPEPMIPVLDDRLVCPVDGDQTHRLKIESYNELLEAVYIRELELSKLKAGLVDMKHQIVEEGQTLDNKGSLIVLGPATEAVGGDEATVEGSQAGDAAADGLSDSGSDVSSTSLLVGKAGGRKRRGSKGKGKGKGRERVRISGEEMQESWDYNVNPGRHVRRISNPFVSDGDDAL